MTKEKSFLECPFHKYFIVPLIDVFTLGMYGGTINRIRLEKQINENFTRIKNGCK
jgi:hypothetical protein